MKVIVDLCVVPIGVGVHLAPYIAACEKVLINAGLKIQLHPNGTAIEGEWEPVFAAIEACHQAVHAMGCPRVYTTVKINVNRHAKSPHCRHEKVLTPGGRFSFCFDHGLGHCLGLFNSSRLFVMGH